MTGITLVWTIGDAVEIGFMTIAILAVIAIAVYDRIKD